MSKYYHLFLDDDPKRIPHKLSWIELPPVEWTIVRNYKDFINTIKQNGIPASISFDHDLDDSAYKEYFRANESDKIINYNNIKEPTGMHCADWLVNYCVDNCIPLPPYYMHTLNYMGAANIYRVMENGRKYLMSFTIQDMTSEEKSAWRDRMKKRKEANE